MTIKMSLSTQSIEQAIKTLEAYSRSLDDKAKELCRRLAELGMTVASAAYDNVAYTRLVGDVDYDITVEPTENGYKVLADGNSVLFIEFGAGIRFGDGHPLNSQFGMGPGTFNPESDNWKSPYGWWTPGGEHTYGNQPSMGMYYAGKEIKNKVEEIAREVFSHD